MKKKKLGLSFSRGAKKRVKAGPMEELRMRPSLRRTREWAAQMEKREWAS
jgi:hypothetical protein